MKNFSNKSTAIYIFSKVGIISIYPKYSFDAILYGGELLLEGPSNCPKELQAVGSEKGLHNAREPCHDSLHEGVLLTGNSIDIDFQFDRKRSIVPIGHTVESLRRKVEVSQHVG